MAKSSLQNLLTAAIETIYTPEDIVSSDDHFILAVTKTNKLIYISSIHDVCMAHIESSGKEFSLLFTENLEPYITIVSGFDTEYTLKANAERASSSEVLNTGFIGYLVPAQTSFAIAHPEQKKGCFNIILIQDQMIDSSQRGTFPLNENSLSAILQREFDFEIGTLLKNLSESLNQNKLDQIIYRSYMFQLYALYLMRFHKTKMSSKQIQLGKIELKVAKAAAIIESDLSAFISVSDIAQKVGINISSLQQGFKENIGTTINEFVKRKRLEKSTELLRSTDLDISEIVYKIGLNSRSYFSELFRKAYLMTPTEFRKKYRSFENGEVNFERMNTESSIN